MTSPSTFSPRVEAALDRARVWHAGQVRTCDGEPFAAHLLAVAGLLRDAGCVDAIVTAGALHDVLEQTMVDALELSAMFGAEITELIVAVSDDEPDSSYRARKRALRTRVRESPDGALLIFAADLIANIRELGRVARREPARYGPDTDDDTVREMLEHYRAGAIMLVPLAGRNPLVRLLVAELGAYDRLAAS
jgi:(p)ppGpp synthase/HD superfamily hydrolase